MKKIVIPILILASILLALASQTSQEEPSQIKQNIKKEKKQTSDLSLENEIKKSYLKPEYDTRLDIDPRAKEWYDISDFDEAGAFNIGFIYKEEIKDYEKAEFWYKKAYSIKNDSDVLFSLGLLYKTIKKYDKAIFFYKKADRFGDKNATISLANLYEDLNNYEMSIFWHLKAINENNNLDALKNLSRLYHHRLKDDVKAVKYYIPLANKKYPKEKLIRFFKVKWNLDDETIKKGYKEQLKAKDIPENLKYKDGL